MSRSLHDKNMTGIVSTGDLIPSDFKCSKGKAKATFVCDHFAGRFMNVKKSLS